MTIPKDKVIKELEAEILRVKTELIEVKHERDAIKKQFDELKVILRETWKKLLRDAGQYLINE